MLSVQNITRAFGTKSALENVSFSVRPGEITGLVGPNGSGKTTLLNILTSMLKPSAGSFHIDNKIKMGMSISRKGFFDDMTTEKNLFLFAMLLGVTQTKVRETMKEFAIDFGNVRFGKLSAGMKQRVSLIPPFIRHNDLILLDEPSNHLDVDSILKLRATILRLKHSGVAFLITSHIFSDLEKICDRILFLKNGKLVTDSATDKLIQEYGDLESAYLNIFTPEQ